MENKQPEKFIYYLLFIASIVNNNLDRACRSPTVSHQTFEDPDYASETKKIYKTDKCSIKNVNKKASEINYKLVFILIFKYSISPLIHSWKK